MRLAAQIKPVDAQIVPTRFNAACRAGHARNCRILRAGQAIQQRIGSGWGGGVQTNIWRQWQTSTGGGVGGLSAGRPHHWA